MMNGIVMNMKTDKSNIIIIIKSNVGSAGLGTCYYNSKRGNNLNKLVNTNISATGI